MLFSDSATRTCWLMRYVVFFFQAEDGIRDLVRSRGLGDVYKRQVPGVMRVDLTQVHVIPSQIESCRVMLSALLG